MSILDKLKTDHENIARFCEELQEAEEGTREELFAQLKRELESHALFEEEVFYPAVTQSGKQVEQQVEQALSDHDEITSLLENLNETETAQPEWSEQFEMLVQAVDEHVAMEEEELFDLAAELLDQSEADELADKYDRAKEVLPKRRA